MINTSIVQGRQYQEGSYRSRQCNGGRGVEGHARLPMETIGEGWGKSCYCVHECPIYLVIKNSIVRVDTVKKMADRAKQEQII